MLEGIDRTTRPRRGVQRRALAMGASSTRKATRTLLLVEDDPILAMAAADELAALGYEVVAVAEDGAEAVALARRHEPDLVVMDVRLPGAMDGVDAAAAIRGEIAARIVFVTAHVDLHTRGRMDAVGHHGILAKPYTFEQLARAIRAALAD